MQFAIDLMNFVVVPWHRMSLSSHEQFANTRIHMHTHHRIGANARARIVSWRECACLRSSDRVLGLSATAVSFNSVRAEPPDTKVVIVAHFFDVLSIVRLALYARHVVRDQQGVLIEDVPTLGLWYVRECVRVYACACVPLRLSSCHHRNAVRCCSMLCFGVTCATCHNSFLSHLRLELCAGLA